MDKTRNNAGKSDEGQISAIFSPPKKPLARGAWLWWFWLFFIHDENTKKTGRCRQIMILWSVKNDPDITCNGLRIRNSGITADGRDFGLDGAAAAWYYDGKRMREGEEFVLEKSRMILDPRRQVLDAPGETPSSFCTENNELVTRIHAKDIEFELRAKKTDPHWAVGPTYGHTPMMGSMEIEGTRLERLELKGWEKKNKGRNGAGGGRTRIRGTAYFQKILLAAPPPQWYWGLYHFADGSFATYMLAYAGRAALAHNMWGAPELRSPTLSIKQDILVYHAPTGRVYEGNRLTVKPSRASAKECWKHVFAGSGKDFDVTGEAEGYAHACWTFQKNIGMVPLRSTFKYNEYPAVLKRLEITPADKGGVLGKGRKTIVLENGIGNMENSWGFLI